MRALLGVHGLVAISDFRVGRVHAVAPAILEAMINDGLRPVCIADTTLYAGWSDVAAESTVIRALAAELVDLHLDTDAIMGIEVLRLVGTAAAMRPSVHVRVATG